MSEVASPLFAPVRVGRIELSNRIVMAPMTRSRAGTGRVTTAQAATYYAQRASAGLIITEATHAAPLGFGYPDTPGIVTEAQVEAWRRVTDAVHARGGRIFVQLWHVGRVAHPWVYPNAEQPVGPSAVAATGTLYTARGPVTPAVPRPLEIWELPAIVESFAEGAQRAIAAGFDGVEVHGANGYLLDQFLRDGSNHRTDAYGGPVENRARLLLEVVDAVSAAIGADRTGVRLSPVNAFNGMSDSDPAATFTHVAQALSPRGLAYLHVSEAVPRDAAPGAPTITDRIRAVYDGTLIANGGFDQARATDALRAGRADLIAFGVPFIANPDLVERFRAGAPLAAPDPSTFYGGDERGYVDYPAHDGTVVTLDDAEAERAA